MPCYLSVKTGDFYVEHNDKRKIEKALSLILATSRRPPLFNFVLFNSGTDGLKNAICSPQYMRIVRSLGSQSSSVASSPQSAI